MLSKHFQYRQRSSLILAVLLFCSFHLVSSVQNLGRVRLVTTKNCSFTLLWEEDKDTTGRGNLDKHIPVTKICDSSPAAFFLDSKWYVQGQDLICEQSQHEGAKALFIWKAGGVRIQGFIRVESGSNAIIFGYTFLNDARISGSDSDLPQSKKRLISNFPALRSCSLKGRLSWQGSFVQPRSTCETDGLCVMFDEVDPAHGLAIIASPLNNFPMIAYKTKCVDSRTCDWTAALPASLRRLPEGFRQEFVVVAGNKGVTQLMNDWGTFMRKTYRTKRVYDVTIDKVGYQTDNGAQYCFCKSKCDQKLLDVSRYIQRSLAIPLGYLSFQNAWWPSTGSAPWCVEAWESVKSKIPMGVEAFQQRLALPLQLYSPYLCSRTPYAKSFDLIRSNPKLEGCAGFDFQQPRPSEASRFYSFLFGIGSQFGMVNYEIDFVNQNLQCVNEYFQNHSSASMFLDGVNAAAERYNLTMQWCFANPNAVLQSLKYGRVTNMRASFDYYYGGSWDIGTSSLFLWALDIRPSTDTFWTTPNGNLSTALGGCDRAKGCPLDHQEDGCELHTLLAVMSGGPVGFSDAIGMTDPVRLRRVIRADGVLLQPSKPVTQLDRFSSFLGAKVDAYILGSFSGKDSVVAYYIVAHHLDQLSRSVSIKASDLWPKREGLGDDHGYIIRKDGERLCWQELETDEICGLSFVGSEEIEGLDAGLIKLSPSSSTFAPELYTITPVRVNGWSFLGEVDKYVAVADKRFAKVEEIVDVDRQKHFRLDVRGSPLENITLVVVQPLERKIIKSTVTVPAGSSRIIVYL